MTFEELDEIAAKHGLIKLETANRLIYKIEHQIFPTGSDILIVVDIGFGEDDKVCLLNRLGTLDISGYCTLYNDKGKLGEIIDVSVDQVDQFIMERKAMFDKRLSLMVIASIESSESTLTNLMK